MDKYRKIMLKVLSGTADKNISFNDVLALLTHLGFQQRIKGDHHIMYRSGIREIINLQPQGNKAKPYQVKQVRNILIAYKLGESIDD